MGRFKLDKVGWRSANAHTHTGAIGRVEVKEWQVVTRPLGE